MKTSKTNSNQEYNDLVKITEASHKVMKAQRSIQTMTKEKIGLLQYVDGDTDLIEEKLKKYRTDKEFYHAMKSDDQVNDFFVNEDGTTMTFSFPKEMSSKIKDADIMDLKRYILNYLWQSDMAMVEFQDIIDQFEQERAQIEKEMGATAKDIVIDCLREALRKKADLPDGETPNKELKHILSGFDFSIQMETLKKQPTIVTNTLKDFRDDDMIMRLGKRYRTVLDKGRSAATLITFISNSPDTSIEEMYLPPNKYKSGYENLFLFSLIRHYAMTYWDTDVRRMHAMTISLLDQFINDELPSDLQEVYVENIATYLKSFV